MKEGQVGFEGDDRFNTFGKTQNAIYKKNKSNKINGITVLKDVENRDGSYSSYYFKDVFFIKSLLISNLISIMPNGNIEIGKRK